MTQHTSCTIHRPSGRFHILFEDLRLIAADDIVNASALRILEQKTDARIENLRDRCGIPDEEQLPPDDLLWIDESEVSLRELESWSLRIRRKSSFARALRERNPKQQPASLIQLGYVRQRWIARRNNLAWPTRSHAEIQRDEQGPFLLVENGNGDYWGLDGLQHHAALEGYCDISRQFLYCFEKVNRAISALDGYDPPEPLPRWRKEASGGTTRTSQEGSDSPAQGNTSTLSVAQKGNSKSTSNEEVFVNENTTDDSKPSSLRASSEDQRPKMASAVQQNAGASNKMQGRPTASDSLSKNQGNINKNSLKKEKETQEFQKKDSVFLASQHLTLEDLRIAPRTPMTLLGLLSTILDVPDPSERDQDTWERDWQHPMERLASATSTLSDVLAWERIGITASYMTEDDSPSWWVQERARRSPITARHVADNYLSQWKDCQAKHWSPAYLVAYDGPPLTDYERGYQAEDAAQSTPQPPEQGEDTNQPVIVAGLTKNGSEALCREIWTQYPDLPLSRAEIGDTKRFVVGLQIADDQYFDLYGAEEWRDPSTETQEALAAALAYVAAQIAADDQEEPQPPPIVLEAPEPPDLPPIAPSKTGMALDIALRLLAQIEYAGYQAELRELENHRALITVETAPGQWQDFERAAAWQQWQKASRASPGSIAAVIASQGGLAQSQAVQS